MGGPLRVWLLDGGTLTLDRSQVLWNVDPTRPMEVPVFTALLEYSDALVLFDSGFDLDVIAREAPQERPQQSARQTLREQLALCGFGCSDVGLLLHSHLHVDHVGGDRYLSAAEVHVDRTEYRHAQDPPRFEAGAYVDRSFVDAGRSMVLFDGDHEVRPGLHLLATPGHSVGHCSLLVERDDAVPLLLLGDVVYTREAWDREVLPGFHHDPTVALASLDRAKAIARSTGAEVVFAHEPRTVLEHPIAPAVLQPTRALR